ncbi:hypothetical protein [Enterobacter chuandaensis]
MMAWWVGCLHCCGKWYEAVAAWLGEYHQVMADLQPVVVTSP